MALMGSAFYPNQHFDTLPTTLIIAGSDSGGGAGLQADMKACCALGAYSTTVLTALTAQNTQGAQHIFSIPLDWISKQIDSVLQDIHVDCVKTGMLGTKEVAHLVAQKMEEYQVKTLVVDPCMICRSGNKIMQEDAVPVVRAELIPKALIITPNYFEACTLLGPRDPPHRGGSEGGGEGPAFAGLQERVPEGRARGVHRRGVRRALLRRGPVRGVPRALRAHAQHARHGLHAGVVHRGGAGARPVRARGREGGEGLRQRGRDRQPLPARGQGQAGR